MTVKNVLEQKELLAKELNKIKEGKSELFVTGLTDVHIGYDLSEKGNLLVVSTVKVMPKDKFYLDVKCLMTKDHYDLLVNKKMWNNMVADGSLVIIGA